MLACKHCSTPNSLDSTFCKKCGTAVPADQKREATVLLDKLVEEGLAALAAGRTAEALAIADSAVATDPTHLGALHLKSAVHERRGEIADALESAERIVELNPDSELDRIKRNGLRTSLLNASTPVQADRRVAFAAAAAAMVLVACAGVLVARRPQASTVVASNSTPTGPVVDTPVETRSQPAVEAANPNAAVPASNTQEPATNPGDVPPLGTSRAGNGTRRASNGLEYGDPGFTRQLPDARGEMVVPDGPINPNVPTTNPPTTNPPSKPPITRRDDGGDPAPVPIKDAPKEDAGQIEITVSRNGGRRGGGTMVPETRTNGSTAYARVGTERFELGDYSGAAANLEKAVAGGGDPVELNRRLAQAYGRLGRNSEAASAYERSRAAADAALASGKGDKERLQSARDAAEAGLKTVKGG